MVYVTKRQPLTYIARCVYVYLAYTRTCMRKHVDAHADEFIRCAKHSWFPSLAAILDFSSPPSSCLQPLRYKKSSSQTSTSSGSGSRRPWTLLGVLVIVLLMALARPRLKRRLSITNVAREGIPCHDHHTHLQCFHTCNPHC